MPISFEHIRVGSSFSRVELATLWGYSSFHAIARGVVTPRDDNKIVLFVTQEKQDGFEQYQNDLQSDLLCCEGPTDHFAENRVLRSTNSGDEIHLFYRDRHHSDFVYQGELKLIDSKIYTDQPSRFTFRIKGKDKLLADSSPK